MESLTSSYLSDAPTADNRLSTNGDDTIELGPDGRVHSVRVTAITRFTPNEMSNLKAETGRTMTDIQNDETDGMRLLVWLTCRRAGHRVTWDEAGDIEMEFRAPELDPTSGDTSTSVPPSATTSASPPPSSTP